MAKESNKTNNIWLLPVGIIIGMIIITFAFTTIKPKITQKNNLGVSFFKEECINETWIDESSCKPTLCECAKNTTNPCMAYCSVCDKTITTLVCEKGIEIKNVTCLEEYCPTGTEWLDGSKVCYDSQKPYGIVDGVGCKRYIFKGNIIEIRRNE